MSLQDAKLLTTPNAYKAGKLYSVLPEDGSGDFTASRATTATRVNENGLIESVAVNVPRIDYTNGSCPSILVEPQRTNLLTYSEEFDNGAWFKFNATITANATTAPDDTLSADELFFTANNDEHIISQSVFISNGTTVTQSYFVKNNNQDFIQIFTAGAPFNLGAYVNFDLSSGVISRASGPINGKIESYNDEWYKISVTVTAITTGNGSLGIISIPTATSGFRPSYTAGGESIFIWGAQLEEGTEASSYIPTTSSQVTRNADVLSTTVPAGVTEIVEELEDGTTNTITNIPATYTPDPNRYKYILMQ